MPPIVGGLIAGLSAAGAVFFGVYLQRRSDAQARHQERVHRARITVLRPLAETIERILRAQDIHDGHVGFEFESARLLRWNEDFPYAREAGGAEMYEPLQKWFALQQRVEDLRHHSERMAGHFGALHQTHWNDIHQYYTAHLYPIPAPVNNAVLDMLTLEEKKSLEELAASARSTAEPLRPTTHAALDAVRKVLDSADV